MWKSSLAVFESRQPEEPELLNFCAARQMVFKSFLTYLMVKSLDK